MSATVVEFEENLDIDSAQGVLASVDAALEEGRSDIVFDLGQVEHFDSAGMGVVMMGIRAAQRSGAVVKVHGMSAEMLDFFSLVSIKRLSATDDSGGPRGDFVSRLGGQVLPLVESVKGVAQTAGEALRAAFVWPLRGRRWRLDRIGLELEAAFLGALPVVLLIGFLLGLILAMQAYVQLSVWGADLYMADMVGVSVVYEIGPLMTGIILAARSGSSNAAQLGSMVVAEELDALKQMGIRPMSYLVLPKILALAFAVLGLCLVFDYVAIVGGALFGYVAADIAPNVYMQQTAEALRLSSFLVAAAKCSVFGALIGVVGCGLGIRVTGGSQGVGRATTEAVVFSIFCIIVLDAIFVAGERMWPA